MHRYFQPGCWVFLIRMIRGKNLGNFCLLLFNHCLISTLTSLMMTHSNLARANVTMTPFWPYRIHLDRILTFFKVFAQQLDLDSSDFVKSIICNTELDDKNVNEYRVKWTVAQQAYFIQKEDYQGRQTTRIMMDNWFIKCAYTHKIKNRNTSRFIRRKKRPNDTFLQLSCKDLQCTCIETLTHSTSNVWYFIQYSQRKIFYFYFTLYVLPLQLMLFCHSQLVWLVSPYQ